MSQFLDEILCTHQITVPKAGIRKPVHGTIIRKNSSYFDARIRNSDERELRLPWEQYEFLECGIPVMVDYIQCNKSKLQLTDDNCLDLYMTADYVLHSQMRNWVLEFVRSRCAVSVDFALTLWSGVDDFYLPELCKVVFEEILARFPSLSTESKSWLSLTPDQVYRILRHDSLNCDSERLVFEAALSWLKANWRLHRQHAERLMSCTRLGLLQRDEVAELSRNRTIRYLPNLQSLWLAYPKVPVQAEIRALYGRQADLLSIVATPRQPHQAVLVFGGWGRDPTDPAAASADTGPQAACQVYNPRADAWTLRCPGTSQPPSGIGQIGRRVYAGCLALGDIVYIVGGYDGQQALRTVSCYNLRQPGTGWYEGSCMLYKRYYVSCASVGNLLYAIGGHSGEPDDELNSGRLNSVERMHVGDNFWKQIASLRVVRSDAGTASIGERVYVAGGFDGHQYHDSAEVYDPAANQWTLIRRMDLHRGGVALIALHGALYAVGGNDGGRRLQSIEMYRPESDKWTVAGQLSKPKSNLSAAVIGDRSFLAIGGWSDDGNRGVLGSVEKFFTDTGTVLPVASVDFAASATAACTVHGQQLVGELVELPAPRNPWRLSTR